MFSSSPKKDIYSINVDYKSSPWWNRRTKVERILCFVTAISLLVLAAFAVFENNFQNHADLNKPIFASSNARRFARQVNTEDVCDTPECIKTGEEIKERLDESVNPCDNFYKFACGGWMEKHDIPDDKSTVSTLNEVVDALNLQLKGLLDKQLDGFEPKTIKIVKDMYDSCMNTENIEKSGGEPLKKVLTALGGWPVVMGDDWNESNFDWMESLFAARNLGFSHKIIFAMDVSIDMKNNTVYTIDVDQAPLGMPDRSYLLNGLNDSATQAYFNLMVKSAKKLGANEQTVENELLQVLNFETTLANHSLPNEERRDFDSMYHKYTIPQLKELVPQIDWLKYFNGLLDETVTETETVIVYVPDYLKNVGELIKKTDKRVLANYMVWWVVMESMGMLSPDWKALEHEYKSAISGKSKETSRWEQCLHSLSKRLAIGLGSYYIKHYFKGDSKQKAMEIVEYLSKELLNILNEIDWMDNETRKQAIEKANAIKSYIGYPNELLNDSIVIQYYENLTITNENYFSNVMNVKKWAADKNFANLRKPNIKGEWKDHAEAAVVNAFYDPLENSIKFPAGILQKIFFNKDRPNYMNYGAIGYVIGHEITHGFDDMGKQFDKDGNNRNWWDKTTDDNFKEKAKCIIDQYSNYTTENGLALNGITTQGENIADNGGMKEAYLAYHAWVKDHSPEGKLPGLKYTPSQLYWISSANVWCAKYRPEYLKLMILTDPHSPAEFRVNGPLSNFEEFSSAFECPPGSNMNPEKKCKVW